MSKNSAHRVVVTGLGVVSPIGNRLADYWQGLKEGRSGIDDVSLFDCSDYPTKIAGEVTGFDVDAVFDKGEARRFDRFSKFALAAANEAIKDSGVLDSNPNLNEIGCVIGTGIGGLGYLEVQHQKLLEKGPGRVSPFLIPGLILNMASALVSMKFGLLGHNVATVSACASGAHAIGDGMRTIQRGEAVAMVVGGAEACITPLCFAGFCSMKAMSKRNEEPKKASRPFDKDRDGFVMGEGAGILVLESLENAQNRGARIYSELIGYASTADAFHITAPAPEGRGAASAMNLCLKDAELNPQDVGYINAHGTSTSLNDERETMAIHSVFGGHAEKLAVSSTKSMTGHLLGAAGAIEAIATLMAIKDGIIPPTINLDHPSDECDLDYVPHKSRQVNLQAGLTNSLGFGGHNVCLAFQKFSDAS